MAGAEGLLWCAEWLLGDWEVEPTRLWIDISRSGDVAERLVHLLVESASVTATFSALDEPAAVADAIGFLFDAIIRTGHRGRYLPEDVGDRYAELQAEVERLPAHVQMTSALSLMDPFNPDAFTIFGA